MNREVCRHFAPLALHCLRCRREDGIDPKSLAGVLFREHDNADQALRYAERMARTCDGNMALDYAKAADQLRAVTTPRPPAIEQ